MTYKQIKLMLQEWKSLEHIARSVVDDRQPFFKENGELLTVKQKMSQKAH